MNPRSSTILENDSFLFGGALAASLLLHGLIFTSGRVTLDVFPASRRTVEIDLTHSARIGGLTTQNKASRLISTKSQPQEWVVPKKASLPDPMTVPKVMETATPSPSSNVAGNLGELGGEGSSGSASSLEDGYADVTHVSRYPQLLNLGELQSNLRRFYPEYERVKRNEGNVTLNLRIDDQGRVVSVETVRAASPAFEEAAKKVAFLLKFKPAMVGRNKVAVKLRQTIQFKLEDF